MSNHLVSARTVSRSRYGVKGPKTFICSEERREKKTLHRMVLDRVRAEYKIRKIRRWVQKAVEFVPSMILGWLKAVRACFNRKFRKWFDPTDNQDPTGLIVSDSKGKSVSRSSEPPLVQPFPLWWAWNKTNDDNSVSLFFGKELDTAPIGLRQLNAGTMGPAWTKPEALGGPHLEVEPVLEGNEIVAVQRKVFRWDLPVNSQNEIYPVDAYPHSWVHRSTEPINVAFSQAYAESVPFDTDVFESMPGFQDAGGNLGTFHFGDLLPHRPRSESSSNPGSDDEMIIEDVQESSSSEEEDGALQLMSQDSVWTGRPGVSRQQDFVGRMAARYSSDEEL
jgi:hypothetical protein